MVDFDWFEFHHRASEEKKKSEVLKDLLLSIYDRLALTQPFELFLAARFVSSVYGIDVVRFPK